MLRLVIPLIAVVVVLWLLVSAALSVIRPRRRPPRPPRGPIGPPEERIP